MRLLDLLAATAGELVETLQADACAVSRVIGDVLILVTERVPAGTTLVMGQGYLVTDFPQTQDVLATGRARAITLSDAQVDGAEAAVLEELGFGALLMLQLQIGGSAWGLVEVYRISGQPFDGAAVRAAEEILGRTSARAG